jgi:catechol 2,3-dioxygenase-like lactoylglutathione lyase family enzyme
VRTGSYHNDPQVQRPRQRPKSAYVRGGVIMCPSPRSYLGGIYPERDVLTRLDHLVILVRDLDRAIRDYETLGFTVTPGGEHADGLTSNALIPFKDGSYLELVAFLDPDDSRDNVWGWRPFLSSGGGLIDYCAASDDLGTDVRRLEDCGFDVEGPTGGGRRLPDGPEIRWRTARIHQDGRLLPFLIEDLTPRSLRVPNGPPAEHRNRAAGISRLEVAVSHAEEAATFFTTLTGSGSGASLRLGDCELSMVAPGGEVRRRLDAAGPLEVGLASEAPGSTEELDRRLSHGVSVLLLR